MHSTKVRSAVRRGLVVVGLSGGITLLGAGLATSTASADETEAGRLPSIGLVAGDQTSGEDGTASGNQADVEADAPVDVSDNQVTVIGDGNESSGGSGESTAEVSPSADVDHTSGEDGTASGNQVEADVEAPVDVTGNQVTVIGDGNESAGRSSASCSSSEPSSGDTTSGRDGTLSGNQTDVDVDAPVDANGNQVTVIGDGNESGGGDSAGSCQTSDSGPTGEDQTSGEDGTGSGNQVDPVATAPVDVSGNQVTVIGDGNESGGSVESGSGDSTGSGEGDQTSGEDGTGSGNQVDPVVTAPVDVSGNQVTVIGDDNESGEPEAPGSPETPGGGGDDPGDDPGDGDDPGEGDGPDEGDNDTDGNDGDNDGQVAGLSGGQGRPVTGALPELGGEAASPSTVLPQTGSGGHAGLMAIAGLALLIAGLGIVVSPRRRRTLMR